ncbi:MAG: hypothetical protein IKW30_12360 [Lachnospiraceae bacterium]|nr:hypothetical protein [Lachnospiraceae bacterium]
MKKKMRLKLWVKIVLFILITGTISILVFQMGKRFGMEITLNNGQEETFKETFLMM